jgi:hypothetical protein
MSNRDDSLGTVMSLVVGGAAGYAATRWLVAPHLGKLTAPAKVIASSSSAVGVALPPPRALAAGPSGDMRPIDPYADVAPPMTDGPITRPSQLAISMPATSGAAPIETRSPSSVVPNAEFASSPRVRRYDSVFQRYRGGIPIEYVRALVDRESNGRPTVRAGSAIGLMQIVPVVLNDYNKRHGTQYRSEHLTNPATNVAIGCELLRIIIASYRKNHPRIRTMQVDWSNAQFVELLTFGWNAGFSEAGGVGRVARYLEGLGAVDITIDQVAAHAKLAGASKHLSNPAKLSWCKSVAALYLRERDAARAVGTALATTLTA